MLRKIKLSFTMRLVLSITTLSILGLVVMSIIVNTTVRKIIYDNVIGVTHRDVRTISLSVDAWFDVGNHMVYNLSSIWVELGVDYIVPIANSFIDEYDYIVEIYAGFADGSYIGGGEWVPAEDWDSTTRPWYISAVEAPGKLVTTIPYRSYRSPEGSPGIVTAVAKWVPELGGIGAVVAVDIATDYIIHMINQYRLVSGGYLILIGSGGEIISHPNINYTIGSGELVYLESLPNGNLLLGSLDSGAELLRFDDFMLGSSYFMTFPLESTGWTLAAVIPTSAVSDPVSQNLFVIMSTFAAVLIALFLLTIFFMSLLTKNMEESRVTEERLRIIIDNMPLVTSFTDKEYNILECNEAAAKLFDLSGKEEFRSRFFELSPERQPDGRLSDEKAKALVLETFETGHVSFEWMHQKPNGEPIPTEVSLTRVVWRGEESVIAFVRDLREIHRAVAMVEQLERAAFTDSLTGARNRRYFMETAEKELLECIEGDFPFSVIVIDVDHFKKVNDTYGHPVGDEVLKIVVARIGNVLKHDTLFARLGGEEFVITLPRLAQYSVLKTAERIRGSVEASPFHIGGLDIGVTISLGVATSADDALALSEILGNADKALYRAKQSGRNRVVTDQDIRL